MKVKLVFFLSFVLASISYAQDYTFKVLVNKGNTEVKAGSLWEAVKVGASLKSTDEIKVPDNAYLGLVHKNGKPLEVKKAGKYKISELESQVGTGASVLNKYTDFILSANTQKKNNLTATGAVHRGDEIFLYLPQASQTQIIFNDVVIISWDAQKLPAPAVVTFNSMFDDELTKMEVKENQIKINLSDKVFANEDNILVSVTSTAVEGKNVSEKHTLKRISKADKERIAKQLAEIQPQTQEQTALNQLVLAGFYEQNNLLIDAGTAYLEAIRLAPEVPDFKEAYENFLLRHALKKAPIKD